MTVEENVKKMILNQYSTVREFAKEANIPYGTICGILRRGFGNSNVENVLKICKALNISADELGEGRIVSITKSITSQSIELDGMIQDFKIKIQNYNLIANGKKTNQEDIELLFDTIDIGVELIKKRINRRENEI